VGGVSRTVLSQQRGEGEGGGGHHGHSLFPISHPLPTSVSDYKSHPLYVLRRHLLKFEGMYVLALEIPPEVLSLILTIGVVNASTTSFS
jgi:hypothetical protein